MLKLRTCWLLLACAPLAAFADGVVTPVRTKSLYDAHCASCHAKGLNKAPVTGSADDWGERMLAGVEGLLDVTKKGMKDMPPKGGCTECTDAELKSIIELMTKY